MGIHAIPNRNWPIVLSKTCIICVSKADWSCEHKLVYISRARDSIKKWIVLLEWHQKSGPGDIGDNCIPLHIAI